MPFLPQNTWEVWSVRRASSNTSTLVSASARQVAVMPQAPARFACEMPVPFGPMRLRMFWNVSGTDGPRKVRGSETNVSTLQVGWNSRLPLKGPRPKLQAPGGVVKGLTIATPNPAFPHESNALRVYSFSAISATFTTPGRFSCHCNPTMPTVVCSSRNSSCTPALPPISIETSLMKGLLNTLLCDNSFKPNVLRG